MTKPTPKQAQAGAKNWMLCRASSSISVIYEIANKPMYSPAVRGHAKRALEHLEKMKAEMKKEGKENG